MRDRIWRWIRVAALAATVSLSFGSVAWGQDWGRYDDGNYYNRDREAREQGFRRGYDDGSRKGQHDAERNHRFKFKNDDWEDSRGYQRWMGDKRDYKYAYREGYERGYREAYNNYGYRYRDRDDWRYRDRDDWR
jgi:hypothetical protein